MPTPGIAAAASSPTKDHVVHVYPRQKPGVGGVIGRAVRTERYRLVEWKKPGAPADSADLELYDYQEDPLETKNLAGERPEVVDELRALLSKHPEAKPQISANARPRNQRPAAPKGAGEAKS